ncbi:MAG: anthranilate phosphoribosyltransferase [Gammaproteobacteria bacterium]|nr:anthranilate phosphoribosyltransferase [Gammaproteobacteria bacterium]
MTEFDRHILRNCIQKVATGPEYSKDLSYDEAYAAMCCALSGKADPVQVGVFLIALRMKRETPAENAGVLQAILDNTRHEVAQVDEVLDIAEPYNGQVRGLPAAPFLAPLLAACGLPAYSHGVAVLGPKFGITHHNVLQAAGVNVSRSAKAVAERLADPAIGWGYSDQAQFCSPLHELAELRKRIVKRPVLTTVEVLAQPIRGREKTHLLTGYVHKAYPPVYATLARQANYYSAVIVHGVEGGVIPSLSQAAKTFVYQALGEEREHIVDPRELAITQTQRNMPLPDNLPEAVECEGITAAVDVPSAAHAAAECGIAALHGENGMPRDSLIYGAAIALHGAGRCESLRDGADAARRALDDGAAFAHFEAGM